MENKKIEDCNRIEVVGDLAEQLLYLVFDRSKIEIEQDGCIRFTPYAQLVFDRFCLCIENALDEGALVDEIREVFYDAIKDRNRRLGLL